MLFKEAVCFTSTQDGFGVLNLGTNNLLVRGLLLERLKCNFSFFLFSLTLTLTVMNFNGNQRGLGNYEQQRMDI